MITIDKIKEYIKCPQFGDLEYGKWGALSLEQREAYKHLIDIVEGLEQETENLKRINEEHKKLNGELRKENDGLVTVIDLVKQYIKEHCEIVRFEKEGVDMIGKVEGIPLLEILEKANESEVKRL